MACGDDKLRAAYACYRLEDGIRIRVQVVVEAVVGSWTWRGGEVLAEEASSARCEACAR